MAGKILIVDDVATNRIVLKVKLAAARYETLQANSAEEAMRLTLQERPDLVMVDAHLSGTSGMDLCRQLKNASATSEIPVILVSTHADAATRLAALQAGADVFLHKPIDDVMLLARLRSLLRARETEEELRLRDNTCRTLGFAETAVGFAGPARIALIAQSRDVGLNWKTALAKVMPRDTFEVLSREDALAETELDDPPDAFVIAAGLSRATDGLRLMSELRSRHATRHAVICVALNTNNHDEAAMALDLGASDLLPMDIAPPPLAQETALRLRRLLERKRVADQRRESVADGLRLAATDPLTGLHNRRYALPYLARIAEHARETGGSFAVMILDLDRFKTINDTHGHAAGDRVLVEVARRLGENLREIDLVARIGGEEFLVALPDATLPTARSAAERLCRAIEQTPIELGSGQGMVSITISIGLALAGGGVQQSTDEVFAQADRALMRSKAGGRNRVHISGKATAA